ncbi:MAG: hypothetical protein JWO02_3797 [Solirubrobacterales bacterium]|nr:hypothetical protein [Solirubrobacterales bacterium]
MRPVGDVQLVVLVATAVATAIGCGEAAKPADSPQQSTPAALVEPLPGHPRIVSSPVQAEAVIRHQREDHCRQKLVEVRCVPRADEWYCDWRTTDGTGFTRVPERPGHIRAVCL